ncbi:MAG: ABC transporter substrate-binding protein [Candidatus Acetothermia bacterium]|jgi:branched-chain amino acid transport system substrate-binding protein|nr:ABC transporter substrate-binding protein [Candidatus Acetothermia bacterium]
MKRLAVLAAVCVVGASWGLLGQTPGVTDTTIKLGSFIVQSGPVAVIGIPVMKGAQAWYSYVNDVLGGIHGRKIEFLALDDAFNPANTVAVVKRLVEQDNIFALVNPLGTIGMAAVWNYILQNNVPVVSPHMNWLTLASPTVPHVFALQPNNESFGRAAAQYAVLETQAKRIGIAVVEDAMGTELLNFALDELQHWGIQPVVVVKYPGTETNFSAYAQVLRQSKAEAVLLFSYLADAAKLIVECDLLGYKPQFIGINTITLQLFDLAGNAAAGVVFPGFGTDPQDPTSEAAAAMREVYARYYPGEVMNAYAMIAYVGAQMVTKALMDAGPNLTRDAFIDALNNLTDWNADGMIPAVTYRPDDHYGIKTLWMNELQIVDGVRTAVFLKEWNWSANR